MNKKLLTLAVLVGLLANLLVALPAAAAPSEPQDPQPRADDTIDIGPYLRAHDLPIEGDPEITAERLGRYAELSGTQVYTVGDVLDWLYLDNYLGRYRWTTYEVVTITEHAEVWVQTDLNYYNLDGTLNPIHPDAQDPLYVTEERIDAIVTLFDDVIYPTDTGFFGMNDSLDGSHTPFGWDWMEADDGSRVVILVSNVRDENFYDPVASSSYIAGFYSSTYEFYSNRNMITIDCKQWNRRVGANVDVPYMYESTLAHELQHLIHDDYSSNEDSWVNEAMSGYAEFLNGFYFNNDLGDRREWQLWPENSVILWDDQGQVLSDYQMVNAFALYTTGRIGGIYTDTAKLTQQSQDGILGFNAWLDDISATNPAAVGLTFEDIFRDFRRDMLFGGTTDGAQAVANWNGDFLGAYNSPLEQVGGPETSEAYLGLLRDSLDSEGYSTPGAPPFGTDFIEVCWSEVLSTTTWPVDFDGDEAAPGTMWYAIDAAEIYTPSGNVTGDVLYSDHQDLTDNFLVFGPLTITTTDELAFDFYYNIEGAWDYGFVQVTTDTTGMNGWTSLDMSGMITETDPNAHPIIAANVPGFSGFSGGWITATYDLGAEYAGEEILLGFRYSTDWATAGQDGNYYPGWALDNVEVGTAMVTTGTVGSGRSIQEVRNAGNEFVFEFLTWEDGDGVNVNNVHDIALDSGMAGTLDLATLSDVGFDEPGERGVVMVSLMLDVFEDLIAGGILPAYGDYTLEGLPPSICTSDVDAYGVTHVGATRVYAGEVVTAEVHLDNLSASENFSGTTPTDFYVGIELPANTTYVAGSASNGAVYTTDLSAIADSFPAAPGVYWTGPVTTTDMFDAGFLTDADLVHGDLITVEVYYANDDAAPDQAFMDYDTVTVYNALGLSGLLADIDPAATLTQFSARLLNMSHAPKTVWLVADHPADTTLLGVTGATVVATSSTQVTVTQDIDPYGEVGYQDITFQWLLDLDVYEAGDVVVSDMTLVDVVTGETFALSAAADVIAPLSVYLPLVMRAAP